MRNQFRYIVSAGVLGCVLTMSAQAANLRFLNDTPITYLKPKDKTSLMSAVNSLLKTEKDGDAQNWTNQGLGSMTPIQAELTATDTSIDGDKTCRKLHIALHAKGQDQIMSMQVCKVKDGNWVVQKK